MTPSTSDDMAPLAGIRVIDFTHVQAGPICSMMLADLGADVIKVESFGGDLFRVPLEGANFLNFNRNKRAIALDLKTPQGREIALALAGRADVLVENFLPGALRRLGLGYDAVSAGNPAIVYGSISGFGQGGPLQDRPAVEPILQAMSGIMEATGDPDRAPVRVRPAMIDYCTGTTMAFAITAALLQRATTGRGRYIDVALLDIALYAMSPYATWYQRHGQLFPRTGSSHPATMPNQNFRTRDGFICIACATERMWQDLCQVLDIAAVASDPRFATRDGRLRHREELVRIIEEATTRHAGAELEEMLLAAGVPCAKVRTTADILAEPHVAERGMVDHYEYPGLGEVEAFRTPIRYGTDSAPLRRRPPLHGEHTAEVLAELGYDEAQVAELERDGVVRSGRAA